MLVSIVKKGGAIVIGVIFLLGLGIALWVTTKVYVPSEIQESSAPPKGDVLLSEFYAQPSPMPQTAGMMVRQEPMAGEATLAKAGENWRIMYSSTEGLSGKNSSVISGALFLPEGQAPEGGWPLLVWSHGTVGIGDICAPSYSGRGSATAPISIPGWKRAMPLPHLIIRGSACRARTHTWMQGPWRTTIWTSSALSNLAISR